MRDWTIVIPVKGTALAKSRLRAAPGLALAIALDTVEVALSVAPVIVVTSADVAPEFEALGARIVLDAGGGLNAAARQGLDAAGSGPVAVMLGDVPAVQPSELSLALGAAEQHPLAFVSDADGDGSVLIAALVTADHSPAFGANSRAAHRHAGYVELDVPATSGLRHDVDTTAHLVELATAGRLGPRTKLAEVSSNLSQ
ncbi:MAG TPA: NTP transferase domain-containing protein [Galbitalea sp.]